MAYGTVSDLTAVLNEATVLELADDTGAGGIDDPAVSAVLAEALDQADREIDAYVSVAHAVPLDPVPGLIANLSVRLAVCALYRRRPHSQIPESWQRACAKAEAMLEDIASGKLIPWPAAEGEDLDPQGATVDAPPRMFGDDQWDRY